MYSLLKTQMSRTSYRAVWGLFFLLCGCCVYLLFRSETLIFFQWCGEVGMLTFVESLRSNVDGWTLPTFVKYSLPDGLYCAAYIILMDAIWDKQNGIVKYFFLSIVPVVAIADEILQYYGIVKGTFDIYDLICYVVPVLCYVFIEVKKCLTIIM